MIQQSLDLAQDLQSKIEEKLSSNERAFHNKMQKLLRNPKSKVMLIELLDRSFRCKERKASFDLIEHILKKYGIADFFTMFEKALLFLFVHYGKFFPNLSVPFFISQLRSDTKDMVLDSDYILLKEHIEKRKNQNITLNVNLIGEEVLGEVESQARIEKYKEALRTNFITYISIKITTIFSQISSLDFEYSKNEIVKRLDTLYVLALEEEKKQGVAKFINLDMEEFRDLELTVAAFMESIRKFDICAGIVLQAYIPDSYRYLKQLVTFSKQRVLKGMKPIKIRFVKGANMENEETIASQRGWELPTFSRKIDTDSNYKKMLHFVLKDENFKYINIGIASHNIFEIAYAYTRINQVGALDSFSFEMLEGMSLQCSFELSQMANVILYAPICQKQHFSNAIAYLVRRLDENTSEQNFMRHFFNLKILDNAWQKQQEFFLHSLDNVKTLDTSTRRKQDRNQNIVPEDLYEKKKFRNESDTDFTLPQNRKWAKNLRKKYEKFEKYKIYPVVGDLQWSNLESIELKDKITTKPLAQIYLAGKNEIKQALDVAKNSQFSKKTNDELHRIFKKAAQLVRERRGDLIALASLETGKTFVELDPEVSEAIDFIEFYPHSLEVLQKQNPKTDFHSKGIGVTIAPWNFPIGISAGTIAAPLAAGNRVIYKPSSLSTLTGYKLCECFWDAGISKDALIFLPSKGSDISQHLLCDENVKFCILTGGEETAYALLKANATLFLSAETGGKNATIVTKFADRDNAIKNIIHSAFSNSGQKCSATSLLILEKEVYEDEEFKKTLVDAAASLAVGSPFHFKNKLGTLCDKPGPKIMKALEQLQPYEEWVLKPHFIDNNEYLMTPGIKYGTREKDFTHMNELFAPILTVMKAENLQNAIELANSTGYGLTAGLESLDEREWELFSNTIEAGNIYINKPTTGAIVLRQPFGGIKKSAIGFGRKVGIYNYITQFVELKQNEFDESLLDNEFSQSLAKLSLKAKAEDIEALENAIMMAQSYAYYQRNEFQSVKEYVKVRGEENLFSYVSVKNMVYRVCDTDSLQDILGVILGANIAKVWLLLSYEKNEKIALAQELCKSANLQAVFVNENTTSFLPKIARYERIRYFAKANTEDEIYQEAAKNAKIIAREKPLLNGRFELLVYYNEKSVSISYHRYGNLGIRGLESAQRRENGKCAN
ncbi:proline dehydrogenase family protein [Campylobacter sp. MIT 21-1685]|uniref:proline dehydrogenase family protein n=1 Tax=unclassified Campylobacter TaxID=2593542 RepID=UPI00224B3A38|nr:MULTISPECIES: proline dehydrogenase family protein [unclassified Campylobacter]MCX2683558.1 proline dehydrogenase family protein [Campylobacter sp. MIT 21-1684]MCX2751847.1 proline dehydrogenase family protein [Campylobacter sp. MIT 21-1682]MCX2808042.1 proline dehydrogenase family protein [Campylobacter sp. MIT 21-1685]